MICPAAYSSRERFRFGTSDAATHNLPYSEAKGEQTARRQSGTPFWFRSRLNIGLLFVIFATRCVKFGEYHLVVVLPGVCEYLEGKKRNTEVWDRFYSSRNSSLRCVFDTSIARTAYGIKFTRYVPCLETVSGFNIFFVRFLDVMFVLTFFSSDVT